MSNVRTCSYPNCDRKRNGATYCRTHQRRALAGKDMDAPISTAGPLPSGEFGKYQTNKDGYRIAYKTVNGKRYYRLEHRYVMEKILGRDLLPHENVHHKNGNRADNRPENLELWVTIQPAGQRPEDLVEYAHQILRLYG